ncbi:major facilitator superfamily protein [Halomonas elongata]|uniref:Major facilitator superfamily protein n=1 Tax=Halomonas elongata TaxID=2746 RepID=A0A1B8P464_HALEL|nr:MFS transporter [Halomonas elongata]OBX37064.1 major facilitator superfamily protein [Halomonas elongata]
MNVGLGLQIVALGMLMVPSAALSVPWVMAAQALSGIAKDLNKMSAKSAVKVLVPKDSANAGSALYRWVAILTGSKNALKGAGFFLGGALLTWIGFRGAVIAMAVMLAVVLGLSLVRLKADLGRGKHKPKFTEVFSKSRAINVLSAARFCLFAARDVWFVVALPVFLYDQHGWSYWTVGGLLAIWVIGYGGVQTQAPRLTGLIKGGPRVVTAFWALALAGLPALLALLPLAEVAGWWRAFWPSACYSPSTPAGTAISSCISPVPTASPWTWASTTWPTPWGGSQERCCPAGCIRCMAFPSACGYRRLWWRPAP